MSIKQLEVFIEANPFEESLYLQLIERLAKERETETDANEKLEQYREKYCSIFYAKRSSFWISWLETRMADAVAVDEPSEADCEPVHSLFLKATRECPDYDVVMRYLRFCKEMFEDEPTVLRIKLEACLGVCGADIPTGASLWQHLSDLEVDECKDALEVMEEEGEGDEGGENSVSRAKERMIAVFHRQLALPLQGNEETLSRFSRILGEICSEADQVLIKPAELEKKVSDCKKQLSARLAFEEALSATNTTESWVAYIAYEVKQKEFSRAQRLYERGLLAFANASNTANTSDAAVPVSFWLAFVRFAAQLVKNWPLLHNVTARALKVAYSSAEIWKYHLYAQEHLEGHTAQAMASAQQRYEAAMQGGFSDPMDYLSMLEQRCGYYNRALRTANAGEVMNSEQQQAMGRAVIGIRKAFFDGRAFLRTYFPTWAAGLLRLCKLSAEFEDHHVCPCIRRLVNHVGEEAAACLVISTDEKAGMHLMKNQDFVGQHRLKSQAGANWANLTEEFPEISSIWLERITWARTQPEVSISSSPGSAGPGDSTSEMCRKLFMKALKVVNKEENFALSQQWEVFEAQTGTIDGALKAAASTEKLLVAQEEREERKRKYKEADEIKREQRREWREKKEAEKAATNVNANTNTDTNTNANGNANGNDEKEIKEEEKMDTVDASTGSNDNVANAKKRDRESSPSTTKSSPAHAHASDGSELVVEHENASSSACMHSNPSAAPAKRAKVEVAPSNEKHHQQEQQRQQKEQVESKECRQKKEEETALNDPKQQQEQIILNARTVVASNLSFEATEGEIAALFNNVHAAAAQKHNVKSVCENVRILHSASGRSRGVAILVLGNAALRDTVIAAELSQPSSLRDRAIIVNAAEGQEDPYIQASAKEKHVTTVFCNNLPVAPSASSSSAFGPEELKALFLECGEIVENGVKIILDRATGQSKGAAMVQFATEAGRKACIKKFKKYELHYTGQDGASASTTMVVTLSKFPVILDKAKDKDKGHDKGKGKSSAGKDKNKDKDTDSSKNKELKAMTTTDVQDKEQEEKEAKAKQAAKSRPVLGFKPRVMKGSGAGGGKAAGGGGGARKPKIAL